MQTSSLSPFPWALRAADHCNCIHVAWELCYVLRLHRTLSRGLRVMFKLHHNHSLVKSLYKMSVFWVKCKYEKKLFTTCSAQQSIASSLTFVCRQLFFPFNLSPDGTQQTSLCSRLERACSVFSPLRSVLLNS